MKINPTPTKAENDAVAKFIAERVAIVGKDGGAARDDLVTGSTTNLQLTPPTTTYLANYTTVLNREALAVLAKTKDVRVRLNIAIVVAKVAANAQNAWLQPTVENLLAADQKESVVLWGMKAAAAVLPQPGGKPDVLLKAIYLAVQAHPNSGPVADEAYNSLQPTTIPPTRETIKYMQDIFELRVKAYSAGIPVDPAVDRRPSVYLTTGGAAGMWTLSTAVEHRRTVQLMCDLLEVAAQQADKAPLGETRDQLLFLITTTCTAVQVVASSVDNIALAAQAKLRLPTNTPAGQVSPQVQPVVDALRVAFQLLKK